MEKEQEQIFCMYGLNFEKANLSLREKYSITKEKLERIYKDAELKGLRSLLIISTCNRTEIYGWVLHPNILIEYFHDFKTPDSSVEGLMTKKLGKKAIEHFFKVVSGLNSQILGDFEIAGQVKQSFKKAKELGQTDGRLERLVSSGLKFGKLIKSKTNISTGSASVSFVAVQYILHSIDTSRAPKILLIGTGKIGRNTMLNLKKYIPHSDLRIINRTYLKGVEFGRKYSLGVSKWEDLEKEVKNVDVIVVACNSSKAIIDKKNFSSNKCLILDLSVPRNVDEDVRELPNISLINVDELSKSVQTTMKKRKKNLPIALDILEKQVSEFQNWLIKRIWTPKLRILKKRLSDVQKKEISYHQRVIENFNSNHAQKFSQRLISKITTEIIHILHES